VRVIVQVVGGGNAVRQFGRAERERDIITVLGEAETAGTFVLQHAGQGVVQETAKDEQAAAVQHQLPASTWTSFFLGSRLLRSAIVGDATRSDTTTLRPAGCTDGRGLQSEGRRTKHRHRECVGEWFASHEP
jgi:hypothetical protein